MTCEQCVKLYKIENNTMKINCINGKVNYNKNNIECVCADFKPFLDSITYANKKWIWDKNKSAYMEV